MILVFRRKFKRVRDAGIPDNGSGRGGNLGEMFGRVRFGKALALPIAAGLLGACSVFNPPVFTPHELESVHRNVEIQDLEDHWKRWAGQKIMVGGAVVSVDNRSEMAYVQIRPMPLDDHSRPTDGDAGRGRVLLIFDGPVDPSKLFRGSRLTVIGTVRRMRYPVEREDGGYWRLVAVEVRVVHTWLPRSQLMTPQTGPIMTPPGGGPYYPSGLYP